MIAEEYKREKYVPDTSISENQTTLLIMELMKITVSSFKNYIALNYHIKQNLNEPDWTQTYLQQATKLIRHFGYPFNMDKEYQDIYDGSEGFSDLYFYTNGEYESNKSIFSIECKRLPAPPPKSREKEYVKGDNNNGGIERYKTEKHGKGLNKCGLLGFVEKENFNHWNETINKWIEDLGKADKSWNDDEILSNVETNTDFCVLKSIAHRKNNGDINLTHLWISIN
ncbi:MAG: hypothetical protein LBE36_04890 [Flavobacteriaceae bacterium]|jgi:hypothetical protein|nr:hypothetical protein [Flavobacteriaceae bacterium]